MDARQQAVNTFVGGLNMDLHPLTTPNNILTDCINGTILTYNGNEYILQNDMGNYKLSTAQLDSNYIPVGIKEYGNIIYIVSYNPIDKKCQVGSYPSPQTIFNNIPATASLTEYNGVAINPIVGQWYYDDNDFDTAVSPSKPNFYDTLVNQERTRLYSVEDSFKLNTGDRYYIYVSEEPEGFLQEIHFYVLSEEKELYDVNSSVKTHSESIAATETDSYDYVDWEIPGWLAYKATVAPIDSFTVYLDDVNIPSYFPEDENKKVEVTLNIQAQISISSSIWKNTQYTNSKEKNYEGLKVRFQYWHEEEKEWKWSDPYEKEEVGNQSMEWNNIIEYGDISNLYANWSYKGSHSSNDIIKLRAIPYVQFSTRTIVVYNNHATELIINLKELFDFKLIKIFDLYKYFVYDDKIVLNFTILAPVKTNRIKTFYSLYKLTEGESSTLSWEPIKIDGKTEIETEYDLIGQNIQILEKEDLGGVDYGAERGIYLFVITLQLVNEEGNILQTRSVGAPIIASKIMNEFYSSESQFQTISRDTWIKKALDKLSLSLIPFRENGVETEEVMDLFSAASLQNAVRGNTITTLEVNATTEIETWAKAQLSPKQKKIIGIRKSKEQTYNTQNPEMFLYSGIKSDQIWGDWLNSEIIYDNKLKTSITNNYNTESIEIPFYKKEITFNASTGYYVSANIQSMTVKEFDRKYLYTYFPIPYSTTFCPKVGDTYLNEAMNKKLKFTTTTGTNSTVSIAGLPTIVFNQFPNKGVNYRTRIRNNKSATIHVYAKKEELSADFTINGRSTDAETLVEIYAKDEAQDIKDWASAQRFYSQVIQTNKISVLPLIYEVQWPAQAKAPNCGGFYFPDAPIKTSDRTDANGPTNWTDPTFGIFATSGSTNTLAVIGFKGSAGNFTNTTVNGEKFNINSSCSGSADIVGTKYLLTGIGKSSGDTSSDIVPNNTQYAVYILQILGMHAFVAFYKGTGNVYIYNPITLDNTFETTNSATIQQKVSVQVNSLNYLGRNFMSNTKYDWPTLDPEVEVYYNNLQPNAAVSAKTITASLENMVSLTSVGDTDSLQEDFSSLQSAFNMAASAEITFNTNLNSLIDKSIYSDFDELGFEESISNQFRDFLSNLIYDSQTQLIKWNADASPLVTVMDASNYDTCTTNDTTKLTYAADWSSLDIQTDANTINKFRNVSQVLIDQLT